MDWFTTPTRIGWIFPAQNGCALPALTQRYFYDWETFKSVEELNRKLAEHLEWSNNKPMRTLKDKSPREMLREKLREQVEQQ